MMAGALLEMGKYALSGLTVNAAKMRSNLDILGGFLMSERVMFELSGQASVALTANTKQKSNDSFSMLIACEDQKEVDSFWDKLLADGGKPTQCGWLKDKFGVSWQVVPNALPKYLGERDPAKSQRIMKAFFAMQKIDLAELERAKAGT